LMRAVRGCGVGGHAGNQCHAGGEDRLFHHIAQPLLQFQLRRGMCQKLTCRTFGPEDPRMA
jgi:hypothetical protein